MGQKETSEFELTLHYARQEKSKDSNSQTTTMTIKNRILNYSVTHGGRDSRPDVSKTFKLDKEPETKLIDYIKKNKLNQNIEEHINDVSPGINGSVVLEIKIANINTKSDISGAVRAWGSKEYLKKQNTKTIENINYYNKIHSLLVFMKLALSYKEIKI